MDYAKMSPMERMRDSILKSMGLTEDDLKKMSPEQQKAVEQKIEQIIKQKLQQNAGQTGQVVDVSA
jgi:TPP-dependent pyruvate/acetoin dehydrogenase alpha subunit